MYQDSSQAEEDKFWTTGQAAIAKWHVDNKVIFILLKFCCKANFSI